MIRPPPRTASAPATGPSAPACGTARPHRPRRGRPRRTRRRRPTPSAGCSLVRLAPPPHPLHRRRVRRAGREPAGDVAALGALRRPDPEAELGRPGDAALVGVLPARGGGPDPGAGPLVLVAHPVLPRHPPGPAVVVDEQLPLGVDGVGPPGEGELEQLRLGDGLGGAGLDAEVAVDAAQVVDLVDEAVALARRDGGVGRVVGAPDVDALGGADTGAELAADALLHPVLVAVEDVAAVEAV